MPPLDPSNKDPHTQGGWPFPGVPSPSTTAGPAPPAPPPPRRYFVDGYGGPGPSPPPSTTSSPAFSGMPLPAPGAQPGAPDNFSTLFMLMQQNIITKAQFDALTGAAAPPDPSSASPASGSGTGSPANGSPPSTTLPQSSSSSSSTVPATPFSSASGGTSTASSSYPTSTPFYPPAPAATPYASQQQPPLSAPHRQSIPGLPLGLQASLAARASASASRPASISPPGNQPPNPSVTSTSSGTAKDKPAAPAGKRKTKGGESSEAVKPPVGGAALATLASSVGTGTRPVAPLPKSRVGLVNGEKCATQLLAEGVPGMPSLAQLQAQLKPESFRASLATVMGRKNVSINEPYFVEGKHVPLYELYQAVIVQGGGVQQVDADQGWDRIALFLNYPTTDNFPAQLAELYHSVLATYEDIWSTALLKQREKMAAAAKEARDAALGATPAPSGTPALYSSSPSTTAGVKFSEPRLPHFNPHQTPVPPMTPSSTSITNGALWASSDTATDAQARSRQDARRFNGSVEAAGRFEELSAESSTSASSSTEAAAPSRARKATAPPRKKRGRQQGDSPQPQTQRQSKSQPQQPHFDPNIVPLPSFDPSSFDFSSSAAFSSLSNLPPIAPSSSSISSANGNHTNNANNGSNSFFLQDPSTHFASSGNFDLSQFMTNAAEPGSQTPDGGGDGLDKIGGAWEEGADLDAWATSFADSYSFDPEALNRWQP